MQGDTKVGDTKVSERLDRRARIAARPAGEWERKDFKGRRRPYAGNCWTRGIVLEDSGVDDDLAKENRHAAAGSKRQVGFENSSSGRAP